MDSLAGQLLLGFSHYKMTLLVGLCLLFILEGCVSPESDIDTSFMNESGLKSGGMYCFRIFMKLE